MSKLVRSLPWTLVVPGVALAALAVTWGRKPGDVVLALVAGLLAGAVLASVHHAEVVAHRVGEPLGSLVLAVAVTIIEVGLIVALMAAGGSETDTLARDTVFAAAMITCNGIVGLCLVVSTLRRRIATFNAEGTATAFATVVTLATLCLVLPTFTTSSPGPTFSATQLAFAGVASVTLYALFVFVQTVRHRDFFVPPDVEPGTERVHAAPPSDRKALVSLAVLVLSLDRRHRPREGRVARDRGRRRRGWGAAIGRRRRDRPARPPPGDARGLPQRPSDRLQTSFNLAYGSAVASIGLTIPAVALASIWLDGSLVLGLNTTQITLLVLTAGVGALTILPGRATLQEGGLHLVIFGAFLLLAVNP